MRDPNQNGAGSAIGRLLITSALGYGLYVAWPVVNGGGAEEWQLYAWGGGALVTGLGVASALRDMAALTQNVHRTFRAMRPKLSNASASWLTKRQARKAGLAKTAGF